MIVISWELLGHLTIQYLSYVIVLNSLTVTTSLCILREGINIRPCIVVEVKSCLVRLAGIIRI